MWEDVGSEGKGFGQCVWVANSRRSVTLTLSAWVTKRERKLVSKSYYEKSAQPTHRIREERNIVAFLSVAVTISCARDAEDLWTRRFETRLRDLTERTQLVSSI